MYVCTLLENYYIEIYIYIFQQYFMHDIFKKKCIIYGLLAFLQKFF